MKNGMPYVMLTYECPHSKITKSLFLPTVVHTNTTQASTEKRKEKNNICIYLGGVQSAGRDVKQSAAIADAELRRNFFTLQALQLDGNGTFWVVL